MKNRFYTVLSLLLAAALAFGASAPALAAVPAKDAAEKEALTVFFNDRANAVKTELPYAVVTYTNGVPEHGISTMRDGQYSELDKSAERFLVPVLEGLFNNNSNLSQAFIKSLFNSKVNPENTLLLKQGVGRDRRVPVYGERYVSALAPADDYTIAADCADEGAISKIELRFSDVPLETAQAGSLGKAFSLPTGAIDPVVIGTRNTGDIPALRNIRFQDFYIANAAIDARYNANGEMVSYVATADYVFAFTFYDVMMLISAFLGYNVYAAVLNAMNVVMANLDRDGVSAEELLRDRQLNIVYNCTVTLDRINWTPRCFGDADGDGAVTAADARAILRDAVDLEPITNAADLVMCDMDFNGELNAADARLALRTSVGLDPAFSEVPEGKEITIADLDAITAPEEEETNDLPGEPVDPGPLPGTEEDPLITSLIQLIFDIVEGAKEIGKDQNGEPEDEFV